MTTPDPKDGVDHEDEPIRPRFRQPETEPMPEGWGQEIQAFHERYADGRPELTMFYVLDENGEPKKPASYAEGLWWFEQTSRNRGRRVMETLLANGVWISTIFLALDHGFNSERPVLWETMAFECMKEDGSLGPDIDCDRCSGGREQAEAMHDAMVEKLTKKFTV